MGCFSVVPLFLETPRRPSIIQATIKSICWLKWILDPVERNKARERDGQFLLFFHALPISLALNLTFHFVSPLRSRTSLSKSRNNIFRSDNDSVKTVFNPLTAEWALRALRDFTLSNARRFYSSMGNPLAGEGLMNAVQWLKESWKIKFSSLMGSVGIFS